MKKISKSEMEFLIYAIINVILVWCATKNIGILNEDIAFGIFISLMTYLYAFLIGDFIDMYR